MRLERWISWDHEPLNPLFSSLQTLPPTDTLPRLIPQRLADSNSLSLSPISVILGFQTLEGQIPPPQYVQSALSFPTKPLMSDSISVLPFHHALWNSHYKFPFIFKLLLLSPSFGSHPDPGSLQTLHPWTSFPVLILSYFSHIPSFTGASWERGPFPSIHCHFQNLPLTIIQ